jgi:hypothetical protein
VPLFGEREVVVGYDYNSTNYNNLIASDWQDYNLIRKIGFYDNPVSLEKYDDVPGQGPNFKRAHQGLFNDPNYCDVHDNFLMMHPSSVMSKFYYMCDYHQLSLLRMFTLGSMGKDTAP